MGITVTYGPSNTTIIDVKPDPPKRRRLIIAIAIILSLAGAGAGAFFAFAHADPDTCYNPCHHSHHSGGGSFGGIGGAIAVAIAAQHRIRKLVLSPLAIEITRGKSTNKPKVIATSDILSVTGKKNKIGGIYKLQFTNGKKESIHAINDELFDLLKTEFQKRYSFPVSYM